MKLLPMLTAIVTIILLHYKTHHLIYDFYNPKFINIAINQRLKSLIPCPFIFY